MSRRGRLWSRGCGARKPPRGEPLALYGGGHALSRPCRRAPCRSRDEGELEWAGSKAIAGPGGSGGSRGGASRRSLAYRSPRELASEASPLGCAFPARLKAIFDPPPALYLRAPAIMLARSSRWSPSSAPGPARRTGRRSARMLLAASSRLRASRCQRDRAGHRRRGRTEARSSWSARWASSAVGSIGTKQPSNPQRDPLAGGWEEEGLDGLGVRGRWSSRLPWRFPARNRIIAACASRLRRGARAERCT